MYKINDTKSPMDDPKKCLAATKRLLEETKLRTALVTLSSLQLRSEALPKLHETIKVNNDTTVAETLKVRFSQQVFKKYVFRCCYQFSFFL